MRYFFTVYILLIVVVISVAGFRGSHSRRPPLEVFPDMDRQPKLHPQSENSFFANGLSSRKPISGTIARGRNFEINPETTGMEYGDYLENIPVKVTGELMERGRQRYEIYCSPCHSSVGDGKGITTHYGMMPSSNFHDAKNFFEMTDGQLFKTIEVGSKSGVMSGYASDIPVEDRWAIVAYIRALQLSRLGTPDDVPGEMQSQFSN